MKSIHEILTTFCIHSSVRSNVSSTRYRNAWCISNWQTQHVASAFNEKAFCAHMFMISKRCLAVSYNIETLYLCYRNQSNFCNGQAKLLNFYRQGYGTTLGPSSFINYLLKRNGTNFILFADGFLAIVGRHFSN